VDNGESFQLRRSKLKKIMQPGATDINTDYSLHQLIAKRADPKFRLIGVPGGMREVISCARYQKIMRPVQTDINTQIILLH
jgi:hypothetical protein